MTYELHNGDCLELMANIPDASVDMILCDLPYQVTKNDWDVALPLDELWKQYSRVIKPNGAIVLFAEGMFMARLMISNQKMWRYNLVWDKVLTSGFLNANRMPLRQHEQLCVFYKKLPYYNPQKKIGNPNHSKGKPKDCENNNYGNYDFVDNCKEQGNLKHPTSIMRYQKPHPSKAFHPTEKALGLLIELICMYTQEGETVLDNCMGSGSTGCACVLTNRNFIGMELDKRYFSIAKERIEGVRKEIA